MISCSVVIPTLNAGPLFREVLGKLRAQDVSTPLEIIVVDSGSRDETLAIAEEFAAQVHHVAPGDFNHGLTRNTGIAHSTGDIIVLMTQDALPADNHLITHLMAAYDDPAVGGAYARQMPRSDADCLTARNVTAHLTGQLTPHVRELVPATFAKLAPMDRYILCNFDNVCSSVRRTVWQEIPFTRNDFGEDLDWSKRALVGGWKIAYVPAAAVIHSHDRPIKYEYKRTYMCHRKLYELFEVSTIPARRYLLRCLLTSIAQDSLYTLRHERSLWKKLSLLAKIPPLSWASVLAQYQGARDERLKRGKIQAGV